MLCITWKNAGRFLDGSSGAGFQIDFKGRASDASENEFVTYATRYWWKPLWQHRFKAIL